LKKEIRRKKTKIENHQSSSGGQRQTGQKKLDVWGPESPIHLVEIYFKINPGISPDS
jgi:hypothetical protein